MGNCAGYCTGSEENAQKVSKDYNFNQSKSEFQNFEQAYSKYNKCN